MTGTTNPADAEIMRLATEADEPEAETKDETLELTDEVKEGEEKAEEGDEDKKPRNHRDWRTRVDALTAKNYEKDREIAELRAELAKAGKGSEDAGARLEQIKAAEPDPNDDKYPFGEADPQYIKDLIRHENAVANAERDVQQAERDKAKAEETAKGAETEAIVGRLNEGMANIEKAGPEKYTDFEEKISAAVEARAGEPLPPMLSIGIAVSPAGADIAYRLATDEATSARIEKLANTNVMAGALAFGELEGEYLDPDGDDSDLDLSDPVDMLRLNGRMKARLKGGGKAQTVRVTKAPAAPEQRARGTSGQFEVGDDTEDFAAFERKIMGKRG